MADDVTHATLGQTVDALGVSVDELLETSIITDVVVLAKAVDMETGAVSLFTASSDGISWLEKLGMLRAAETIENGEYTRSSTEDD